MKKLFCIGLMGLVSLCFFLSCNGGGGGGDEEENTISYTYASNGYVMTITLENPRASSGSMKSIYPGGDYTTGARAVLSIGETAAYTLKYDGIVKSTGKVLMGEDANATFTPASGKSAFTGIFAGTTELTFPVDITLDDGSVITLDPMKQTTGEEAAFSEYWGVWRATISGYPVMLIVGDKIWELWIDGQFDSEGIYTQRPEPETTIADIYSMGSGYPLSKVGFVQTGDNGSATINLTGGAYLGTYELHR